MNFRRQESVDKFWAKVEKRKPEECWPWLGRIDPQGYGTVRVWTGSGQGRTFTASRYSFYLANGYFPPVVCHSCDNPVCVNPDHLWGGTQKDNQQDMAKKGRSTLHERNPMAKLNSNKVAEIKQRLRNKETSRSIAKDYGVDEATIHYIKAGKTWATI